MKLNKLIIIIIISILMAASYLILLLDQATIDSLVVEDGLVESIGTLGLLITSICFLIAFIETNKPNYRSSVLLIKRVSFLVLALVFFFGFGEEISWGQRIFNIETPDQWAEINRQGEINIHNLNVFHGTFLNNTDRLFALFWGTLMVGVPLVSLYRPLGKFFKKVMPIFPIWFSFLFVFNYLIAKLPKILLASNGLYKGIHSTLAESIVEIKETNFGILFAWAGLYLIQSIRQKKSL
jgi:hypothetical protein